MKENISDINTSDVNSEIYNTFSKSTIKSYALWLTGGLFGSHNVYLNQMRVLIARYFIINIAVITGLVVSLSSSLGVVFNNIGDTTHYLLLSMYLIWLLEGALIPFQVKKYNKKLMELINNNEIYTEKGLKYLGSETERSYKSKLVFTGIFNPLNIKRNKSSLLLVIIHIWLTMDLSSIVSLKAMKIAASIASANLNILGFIMLIMTYIFSVMCLTAALACVIGVFAFMLLTIVGLLKNTNEFIQDYKNCDKIVSSINSDLENKYFNAINSINYEEGDTNEGK